jgi:hypothetical protein
MLWLLGILPVGIAAPPARPSPDGAFVVVFRYFHDAPFVRFFLEWYSRLGFRFLVINNDPQGDPPLFAEYGARLTSISGIDASDSNKALAHGAEAVRLLPGAEWALLVDPDEFLVLDAPTVGLWVARQEAQHGRLDAFVFRWALVEWNRPFCDSNDEGIGAGPGRGQGQSPGLLNLTASAFVSAQTKTMSRVSSVARWAVHWATLRNPTRARSLVDGKLFAGQLRHNDYSLWGSTYDSSALVHLYVRSLADLLLKALRTTRSGQGARERQRLLALLSGEPSAAEHAPRDAAVEALLPGRSPLALEFVRLLGHRAKLALSYLRKGKKAAQRQGHARAYTADLQRLLQRGSGGSGAESAPVCIGEIERSELASELNRSGVPWRSCERVLEAVSRELAIEIDRQLRGRQPAAQHARHHVRIR